MKPTLRNGIVCIVKIKGQQRTQRRVFKWTETRFGSILCYVFTSPIRRGVAVKWNETDKSLTICGPRVPSSEVSIPHYDLELCERVVNARENSATWEVQS